MLFALSIVNLSELTRVHSTDIWTGSEPAHREAVEDPNAPQSRRAEARNDLWINTIIASAGY